jgi:polar amino acid transport system permease protein
MTWMQNITFIGSGIALTLGLTFGSLLIGLVIGTLLAILRQVRGLRFIINRYISIARGTPLLLQLSFFYFAIPGIFGVTLSILTAGIISFGFNSSAYIAEIFRSGIEALPKGQFEAAQTLRIPTWLMWKDIILPQVIRNVFPALINEMIALLKETALISTIGGMDLMRRAQSVASEQFSYFGPLCIAGAFYYLTILLIEFAGKQVEKRNRYA